eukprot:s14_g17.t1
MLLLRQDKKKKKDEESEDENDDFDHSSKSKKAKKGTEPDPGDDINDEDELLYLQAMDEENNCADKDEADALSNDAGMSCCGEAKPLVIQSVPVPVGSKRASTCTATLPDQPDSQQPKPKVQRTSQQAALKSSPQKKNQIQGQKTALPVPAAQHPVPAASSQHASLPSIPVPSAGASSATGHRQGMPPACPPASVDAKTGVELVTRAGWSKCKPFDADEFASTAPGAPLALPTKYSKETQNAKWMGEVTKLKPFISTLERMLSSDAGKVKDTEIKNAIKAFQKINARVDKKLEFEATAATVQEPTFSARIGTFKEMFEAVKSLKELAISSGKSGSIGDDVLKGCIERISAAVTKLIAEKWISYPLHWAWVTAAVKPKVEDCGVLDASAGAKLHQILFFPPPPADPEKDVPSSDNAYGRISDFYFFCPDSLSVPSQVLKMQSKLVLQTLLRILGSSTTFDAATTGLKAFLPQSMVNFEEAVLSPSLAAALRVWHSLVHSLSGKMVANLEDVLQTASSVVTSKTLQVYHKPITRISGMTHFKRILNDCHQLVVAEKLDQEAIQKANDLKGLVDRLSPLESALAEATDFCFDKDCIQLKEAACLLPSDPASSHAEARVAALALFSTLISKIGQYTVNGILAALSSPDLKRSTSDSADGSGLCIPMPFMKIRTFVQGDGHVGMAGKVNPKASGAKLLQFLPFSERAFLVYVADVIGALALVGKLPKEENEIVFPFEEELSYLSFASAVFDTNRCPSADVIKATEEIRFLGFCCIHIHIAQSFLWAAAKRVAMAILSRLDDGSVSESDLDTLSSLPMEIKPWLDLNDANVERQFSAFLNRKSSSWEAEEMTGPAQALREAVLSVQRLIGAKGSLLDTFLTCSIEKMTAMCDGLGSLGTAFMELDAKHTAWQKSVDESIQMSDKIKGLTEEANLLLNRGKIILACSSGFLSAVWKVQGLLALKGKNADGVAAYVEKLAKRDLAWGSLPSSLQAALSELNPKAVGPGGSSDSADPSAGAN